MTTDVTTPLFLPMCFHLVALFFCWLYYTSRRLWPDRPVAEGRIYRCAGCGHVYVEPRDVPMSRCPQCDRFNEAVKR